MLRRSAKMILCRHIVERDIRTGLINSFGEGTASAVPLRPIVIMNHAIYETVQE